MGRTYIGGNYYNTYHYGGMFGGFYDYSYAWGSPSWYYYTPFHPAFFFSPPYYYGGNYYPGEFSFFRLILGIGIFVLLIWLIMKLFSRTNQPPPRGYS
jgi:hypothetical protein